MDWVYVWIVVLRTRLVIDCIHIMMSNLTRSGFCIQLFSFAHERVCFVGFMYLFADYWLQVGVFGFTSNLSYSLSQFRLWTKNPCRMCKIELAAELDSSKYPICLPASGSQFREDVVRQAWNIFLVGVQLESIPIHTVHQDHWWTSYRHPLSNNHGRNIISHHWKLSKVTSSPDLHTFCYIGHIYLGSHHSKNPLENI